MLGSSCPNALPCSRRSEIGGDRSRFQREDYGHKSSGDCELWPLEGSHEHFSNASQLPIPA